MSLAGSVRSSVADSAFEIRRREKRDADALFRMFDQPQCRQGMVLEPFSSASAVQAWFDSNGSDNYETVATINDTAIAFAGLFPGRGSQSHVGGLSLFVHDQFQGRGLGALLMTAIIATADLLLGLRRIQLTVFCDNERAISLYRKFGFEIEGRHSGFARRGHQLLDAFTMARIAAGGPARRLDAELLTRDLSDLISLSRRRFRLAS
ncbi:GNAT family N-acetyltransferase [Methylocapsa sp. S129]|uniref:GNAT family N-acetyltransferase n=1 Tax=Methylocapsa sp. S129 TaxID=1641869 RepID=UPI00131DAA6E|nr:GNAT family N-acetyltransferase [Methylocapsa sp. S129]